MAKFSKAIYNVDEALAVLLDSDNDSILSSLADESSMDDSDSYLSSVDRCDLDFHVVEEVRYLDKVYCFDFDFVQNFFVFASSSHAFLVSLTEKQCLFAMYVIAKLDKLVLHF